VAMRAHQVELKQTRATDKNKNNKKMPTAVDHAQSFSASKQYTNNKNK